MGWGLSAGRVAYGTLQIRGGAWGGDGVEVTGLGEPFEEKAAARLERGTLFGGKTLGETGPDEDVGAELAREVG